MSFEQLKKLATDKAGVNLLRVKFPMPFLLIREKDLKILKGNNH